jgi:hypothetical protein
MSKQKLDTDVLQVETFPTAPVADPVVAMGPATVDNFTCWHVDCTYGGPCA